MSVLFLGHHGGANKPVPVMVTVVPPLVVPDVGVNEVMAGTGATKV